MSITLNSAATNSADWKTQFQFNDADSGDLIDFTGAAQGGTSTAFSTVMPARTITFYIKL
jgi:hypothetical protein